MVLQVIGAGLGRTGTASLKVALEQLGLGKCYHMGEVMMNPEARGLWIRAADGDPDWEAIFKGYEAAVDYPACAFWRELAEYYPSAKIVLSVRDPQNWFDSTQATIFSPQTLGSDFDPVSKEFFDKTVTGTFGAHIHERDFMVRYFAKHSAEVQRTVPAERLLVFRASQGWDPLCAFLGLPEPDTSFPRVNTREQMAQLMQSMRASAAAPEEEMGRMAERLFTEDPDRSR